MRHIVVDVGIYDPTVIYKIETSGGRVTSTCFKMKHASVHEIGEVLKQRYSGTAVLVNAAYPDVRDKLKQMGIRVLE